jgi:hypothetical protein
MIPFSFCPNSNSKAILGKHPGGLKYTILHLENRRQDRVLQKLVFLCLKFKPSCPNSSNCAMISTNLLVTSISQLLSNLSEEDGHYFQAPSSSEKQNQ